MAEKKKPEIKLVKKTKTAKATIENKNEKAAPAPERTVAALPVSAKNSLDTLRFVLMTEKAVQLIETQNKLVFVVARSARKPEIKSAVEDVFNSKVSSLTTSIDQEGRKKAFVKFAKEGEAGEIAIRLGII